VPDEKMGEKTCAYVVLKGDKNLCLSDVVNFMKDQGIAPFKIPERLEIIDDLPLAGGIKVDKKQLRLDIEAKLKGDRVL
jgi:2,3-dihydroxybenzoate-AMP ligase